MIRNRNQFLAGALALAASVTACAAPVADEARIPVDVRRTTLLVNDTDKSLALYRDALGLTVIYDQLIESPMENGETRSRRLVLLQANDDFIGVLGLLEYIHPKKPQRQDHFDEPRSEENTSELQSRPHISYSVFCLKKKNKLLS